MKGIKNIHEKLAGIFRKGKKDNNQPYQPGKIIMLPIGVLSKKNWRGNNRNF